MIFIHLQVDVNLNLDKRVGGGGEGFETVLIKRISLYSCTGVPLINLLYKIIT